MTTYDPFHFVFDKTLRDTANAMRVDVSVIDADPDTNVLITLTTGGIRIPFFLRPYYARMLAQHLLAACDAQDAAVGKSYTPDETDPEEY